MTFIPYVETVGNRAKPTNWTSTSDRNTWQHWRIVPTSRPAIAPPPLKEHYVDVPGSNGKIDLVQSLTGYPTYGNRTGKIEFAVMNDFRHWQTAYTDIMTTLHGKRMLMVYEEDPEYYYVGRWFVEKWDTGKNRSTLTLSYDLEPYKWRLYDAADSWLWDPFNFSNGVIASRSSINFSTDITVDSDETYTAMITTGAFEGGLIIDPEGPIDEGYADAQENISSVIGNAPVPMQLRVVPDEGKSVEIHMYNPELGVRMEQRKTFTADFLGIDEDFLITNWNGFNNLYVQARGHGHVRWNFRPGRL